MRVKFDIKYLLLGAILGFITIFPLVSPATASISSLPTLPVLPTLSPLNITLPTLPSLPTLEPLPTIPPLQPIGKDTPTPSPTFTPTPTLTPSPTVTSTPIETPSPSPTLTLTPTSTLTPTPTESLVQGVFINEFVPDPTISDDEWVEFYNPDSVDISSYYLDDDLSFINDDGSSNKISLSSLNVSNPLYPYIELSSSILNNNGDFVVLFNSSGDIIDNYQYLSSPGKANAIGRKPDGGNWQICSSTSKGASNNLTC